MKMPKKDIEDRKFWVAKEEEIKEARMTDVYFINAVEVMKKKGLNPRVVMEVYARSLPYPDGWGVVAGIYEVIKLLEGLPVDVYAMEEGEVFLTSLGSVAYEPVLQIEGRYADFATFENPVLGFICSSTSLCTKAARLRMLAGDKLLLSFGTRRVHPAIAPTVERAIFLGGFDGVSNTLGAKLIGIEPTGTMPHSLIICFGDQKEAWKAFDEVLPKKVPRIALVDTFYDEKTESIIALELLGKKLYGVRLDTPSSRRGDWKRMVEEVRWELDIRGGEHVKLFLSGGVDEKEVLELSGLVDGFGIGTSVSAAPTIDFSAKLVEVELNGKKVYRAKRGDLGGKKQVYRNLQDFEDVVTLSGKEPPSNYEPLLKKVIENGKIVKEFRPIQELRKELLLKIRRLKEVKPRLVLKV